MEDFSEKNIWKTWSNSKKSDLIHDFTMRNYDRANIKRDYGVGVVCTPVEAHLLEKICDNSEITITQLAQRINRSKSAVSQIVKKLEKKGLVTKVPKKSHAKKLSLCATEKGKALTAAHIEFDEKTAGSFFDKLSKSFDDDTMDAFFCVLNKFLKNMYASEGYEDLPSE